MKVGSPVPTETYKVMPNERCLGGTQLDIKAIAAGWKSPKQHECSSCAIIIPALNGKIAYNARRRPTTPLENASMGIAPKRRIMRLERYKKGISAMLASAHISPTESQRIYSTRYSEKKEVTGVIARRLNATQTNPITKKGVQIDLSGGIFIVSSDGAFCPELLNGIKAVTIIASKDVIHTHKAIFMAVLGRSIGTHCKKSKVQTKAMEPETRTLP